MHIVGDLLSLSYIYLYLKSLHDH
jgi:hypothetical protein